MLKTTFSNTILGSSVLKIKAIITGRAIKNTSVRGRFPDLLWLQRTSSRKLFVAMISFKRTEIDAHPFFGNKR